MSEGEESRIYWKTEQGKFGKRARGEGKKESKSEGGKTEQGRGNRDKGKEEKLERA